MVLFGRLPAAAPGRTSTFLWLVVLGSLAAGLVSFAVGAGVVALWCFASVAVAAALVLPLHYALVSPLFVGVLAWLVDMLPFVVIIGWGAVVARWTATLVRERRLPAGGRWIWLPIGLGVWTALGVIVIPGADIKHFILLLAIQVTISGAVLAVVDCLGSLEERTKVAAGLVVFVLILTVGVLAEWAGVPLQTLQDRETSALVEGAYGVDAFTNGVGMIKYERSRRGGALELSRKIEQIGKSNPGVPEVEVFQPTFSSFPGSLIVRFAGSARPWERELAAADVELLYDNLGFGPANQIPRLRSFPRNANTYAGIGAAILPFAFFLAWGSGRRRALGWTGVAACFAGVAFSLTRGAWLAVALGIAFLVVFGAVTRRQRLQMIGSFVLTAVVLTAFFFAVYRVDPVFARAKGEGSIGTRTATYGDTIEAVQGKYFLIGYGTEKPRTASGVSHALGRYIPRAGTHSTYLNYLFRTGAPGALMIVALYAAAGLHALAAARSKVSQEEKTWSTLAAAAVLIAAAHGVVLSLYVEPVYTLVISLLLGLAMAGTTNLKSSVLPWRAPPPQHAASR
ncbi:MAG: O-antigen ligase family protein [Actinobacteria bacterium]|nr:O-antigen ligase family protein [Actinomycetota bacterium]